MSVAVMQTPPFHLLNYGWPALLEERRETRDDPAVAVEDDDEDRTGQSDIWSAIQAQKTANSPVAAPYVHPLVRRSSSSLSQNSLQICTESLGSETGSDDFSLFPDDFDYLPKIETEKEEEDHDMHEKVAVVEERGVQFIKEAEEHQVPRHKGKELTSVNYHCSISRRSPPRSFPPPLPSISRRDGPCIRMRPHRRDGRLVVEAVPVPSRNYLHAQRAGGRLLLSFIDATFNEPSFDDDNDAPSGTIAVEQPQEQRQAIDQQSDETEENEAEEIAQQEEEEEEEVEIAQQEEDDEVEEEEEVKVVDGGTVVEVKVSTQPQQLSGGAIKVLRSFLVINKFVGGTRLSSDAKCEQPQEGEASKANHTNNNNSQLQATATAAPLARRPPTTTAAVVVASTIGVSGRNREELLHSMRTCRQLCKPLFFWEPCCIATGLLCCFLTTSVHVFSPLTLWSPIDT